MIYIMTAATKIIFTWPLRLSNNPLFKQQKAIV